MNNVRHLVELFIALVSFGSEPIDAFFTIVRRLDERS